MFRISDARQKSNERVSKAGLDLLKAMVRIGDDHGLTPSEERYILNNLLNHMLKRDVTEDSP